MSGRSRAGRGSIDSWSRWLSAASLYVVTCASSALAADNVPPEWVMAAPPKSTQFEKSTEERGVNPCMVDDPGFGPYRSWVSAGSSAYVMIPRNMPQSKFYDVVVHFHGREAARKQWVRAGSSIVVVGIDLGVGSGAYLDRYADPTELPRMMTRVRELVREATGRPEMTRRKLALESWSAGYGATMRALTSKWGRANVDGVILLDGLHTSFEQGGLVDAKLKPFAEFAQLASRGDKFFFVSHSSIVPPGYASTTATSNYLVWQAGGRPQAVLETQMPMGLEQISFYQKGSFTVRGFRGNGKKDHCAQLGLLDRFVIPALHRRWEL